MIENKQDYSPSVFLSLIVMNDLGVQKYAAWNVEGFPSFRQTLQLLYSGLTIWRGRGLATLLWISH